MPFNQLGIDTNWLYANNRNKQMTNENDTVPASDAPANVESNDTTPAVESNETVSNTADNVEVAAATSVPNAGSRDHVTLKVTGAIEAEKQVPVGTKLKDALVDFATASANQFRDAANRAVSLDRVISNDLAIVAVAKSKGG